MFTSAHDVDCISHFKILSPSRLGFLHEGFTHPATAPTVGGPADVPVVETQSCQEEFTGTPPAPAIEAPAPDPLTAQLQAAVNTSTAGIIIGAPAEPPAGTPLTVVGALAPVMAPEAHLPPSRA